MNDDSPRAPLITHMLGPVDWNWIEQEELPLSVGVYLGAGPTCITRGQIKSTSLFRPTNFLDPTSLFGLFLARTTHAARVRHPTPLPCHTRLPQPPPARAHSPLLYHRSSPPRTRTPHPEGSHGRCDGGCEINTAISLPAPSPRRWAAASTSSRKRFGRAQTTVLRFVASTYSTLAMYLPFRLLCALPACDKPSWVLPVLHTTSTVAPGSHPVSPTTRPTALPPRHSVLAERFCALTIVVINSTPTYRQCCCPT